MKRISCFWHLLGGIALLSTLLVIRPVWALETPPAQTPAAPQEPVELPDPALVQQAVETSAQEAAATEEALEPTLRASLKTIAFQTTANLSDAFIFGAITGISATTGVAFFVANYASAMMAYFPYELVWDAFGPSQEEVSGSTYAIKTAGYQAVTGLRNLGLSYAFTGTMSTIFAGTVLLVDAGIYLFNEYAWDIFSPRAASKEVATQETVDEQAVVGSAAEVSTTTVAWEG